MGRLTVLFGAAALWGAALSLSSAPVSAAPQQTERPWPTVLGWGGPFAAVAPVADAPGSGATAAFLALNRGDLDGAAQPAPETEADETVADEAASEVTDTTAPSIPEKLTPEPLTPEPLTPEPLAPPIEENEQASVFGTGIFARDTGRIDSVICPFAGKVDYKPGEVRCGLLEVPENRDDPDTRMIELHFVKIAARPTDKHKDESDQSEDRDDPILYITGGPGVAVTGYVRRLKNHGVVDHRDLYILEQRGIGFSGDFCPFYGLREPARANALTIEDAEADVVERVRDCLTRADRAGVDLSGYSTIESARDMEVLRRALGIDEWNPWGISYGSVVGQAYLREDPEGIRAAVLDAIVPLDREARPIRRAQSLERSLSLLQETCNADPVCAQTYPDFTQTLRDVMVKAQEDAHVINAIDKEAFPSGRFAVLPDLLGGAIYSMFYDEKTYPFIPATIAAMNTVMQAGDVERFRLLTATGLAGGGNSRGMFWTIYCRDGWMLNIEEGARLDAEAHPTFALTFYQPGTGAALDQVCREFGLEPRPAGEYTQVQTDIRTLIVEGALDPATPPPLAKGILPGFTRGTYLEFPHAGHGPTRSVKCAPKLITAFMDDPAAPVDESCLQEVETPDFSAPLYVTDAPARLAVLGAKDPKSLMVPGIWVVFSSAILILGALIYSVAPVARLVNQPGPGKEVVSTMGARPLAWLTAVTGAVSVIGLGTVFGMTMDADEIILLFGLLPMAEWFLWPGLAAGLLGLILFGMTVFARRRGELPVGTLIGLVLTALAGIALAAFYLVWGLLPALLVSLLGNAQAQMASILG